MNGMNHPLSFGSMIQPFPFCEFSRMLYSSRNLPNLLKKYQICDVFFCFLLKVRILLKESVWRKAGREWMTDLIPIASPFQKHSTRTVANNKNYQLRHQPSTQRSLFSHFFIVKQHPMDFKMLKAKNATIPVDVLEAPNSKIPWPQSVLKLNGFVRRLFMNLSSSRHSQPPAYTRVCGIWL